MTTADISDRWAMVTGASRGIGRQIAIALADLGCKLVLHARDTAHLGPLVEMIEDSDVDYICVAADLSDSSQTGKLIADIRSMDIDILYNNAAIMMPYQEDVFSIPAESFRQTFETNVISPIRLCDALMPAMIERGWGRVVNMTSAIQDIPQLAPYAVSKAALRKYVEDHAATLTDSGVCICSLDPGWLRTDMGSDQAPNSVESVIPGALVPVLLEECMSGVEYKAQDYAGMTIEQALAAVQW